MRRVILSADDFGLCASVNEAVEEAHSDGVLSTASLMVGAQGTAEAVERARRLPGLHIGLHLVLVNGRPLSAPCEIPALTGPDGSFSSDLFRSGVRFFFLPGARRQLGKEIRSQFRAFQETGLPLDHVNCHNHMHLHPTVGQLVLEIGREFGLSAMRYPDEPILPYCRAARRVSGNKVLSWLFLRPWLAVLKGKIGRYGIRSNDFLFGLNDSGAMDLQIALRFIACLPRGQLKSIFTRIPCPGMPVGRIAMRRGRNFPS